MRDRIRVLDARSMTPVLAPQIADWCLANTPGWVWVGDWHTGTSAASLTAGYARSLALGWAVRAECWRRGGDCLVGWGFRPDVLQPQGGPGAPRAKPAAGRRFEWIKDSPTPWNAAMESWPDEWHFSLQSTLDAAWWATALASHPNLYGYVPDFDPMRRTLSVSGCLARIELPEYREWVVSHAHDVVEAVGADWLMVGVKPWERVGSDYLTATNPDEAISSLIQPPSFTKPEWSSSLYYLLEGLEGVAPVLTLTRPPTAPELMGLGGTAIDNVVGEADLRGLS